MGTRRALVVAAVVVGVVLGGTVLAGCGGTAAGPKTGTGPTTEIPADMKSTTAAQVFTAMSVKAGQPEDAVIAQFKAVTASNPDWAPDPTVTLGISEKAKTTSAFYTFRDKSTLELTYQTASGLPADNKLVGATFTKP